MTVPPTEQDTGAEVVGQRAVEGTLASRQGLGPTGSTVHGHLTRLQGAYLQNVSWAVAGLARLRRAVEQPPGGDPLIWDWTINGIKLPRGYDSDLPSRGELAAHAAVTLYAVHQQSRGDRMYRWGAEGFGLGRAIARLQGARDSEAAVRKRFDALATASDLGEAMRHARGIVTQLRGAALALDYAALADQLEAFQDPRRRANVRLAWGRDFHRVRVTGSPETAERAAGSGGGVSIEHPTDIEGASDE